jgi:hypothetical protein
MRQVPRRAAARGDRIMQIAISTSQVPTQPIGSVRRMRSYAVPTSTIDAVAIASMTLVQLESHCATESERFYRGQAHDTRFAYELFRRALVERDEVAWEYVFNHYRGLVESWVRRSGAFTSSGETSEYFVVSAFTRFWQAITAERFVSFNTLAALLHYLQLCAGCVVIDSVRAQSWAEEAMVYARGVHVSPDEEAVERVNRVEFWGYINELLNDESERVVLYSSYVLGMKPGDIYSQRSDLFQNVNDVYNVKRNVLGRLSRNQELRQRFEV